MPGRRGGRRGGRGVSRAVRNYVHRQDRMVAYGRQLRPGNYPGPIVAQPWNTCTVQLGGKGDADITIHSVWLQLTNQQGLVVYGSDKKALGNVELDIRPRSIRVWALAALRPISLSVIWLTEDASQPSQIFTSWPGSGRLPAVGYEWSQVVQTGTYNHSADKAQRIARVDSGPDINWLCYLEVLWRSSSHEAIESTVAYNTHFGLRLPSISTFSTSDLSEDFQNLQL